MKAIFPGTFDPVTLGHVDVIARASRLADELLVAVLVNPDKQTMFTMQERVDLLEKACEGMRNVRVASFTGLLADLARREGAGVIVRGVRGVAEFDLETAMAHANARLMPGLMTVFLPASPGLTDISSSLVRQIAVFHGDLSPFLPPAAADAIRVKYSMTP